MHLFFFFKGNYKFPWSRDYCKLHDQLQARRSDNRLLVTTEILTFVNCESQTQSTGHTSFFSPSYQFENMQFTSFFCWALTVAAVIDSDFLSEVILFGGFKLSITLKAFTLWCISLNTHFALRDPRGMLKLQIGTSRENTTTGFQETLIRLLLTLNISILKFYSLGTGV